MLKEYKVCAPMYKEKFNELMKREDQTYVMYTSTLTSLLNGYLESRKVSTLEDLNYLLISDRVKASLKPSILCHVLSVEAKTKKVGLLHIIWQNW